MLPVLTSPSISTLSHSNRLNRKEARAMRAKLASAAFAVVALALLASPAGAGYCGAARYGGVVQCSADCCTCTVMKTVRCKVYEQKEIQCTRTVYDRVCEDKVINCTRMVPETCQKEVCYTVCKPVWETKTRCYTVCKPVWETCQKEVHYQVAVKVPYTKTIQVQSGNWQNQEYEVPRGKCHINVPSVGTYE